MSENIKKLIEQKLNALLDQPFINMGRASDLLWLSFGEMVATTNIKGEEKLKSRYALHIQCPWRLFKGGKLVLELNDMYIPRTGLEVSSFDWEKFGDNRFDEILREFKSSILSMQLISKITADDEGSLIIDFTNNIKFEVCPDSKERHEFWRFIIFGETSEHFVIFDDEA